MPLLRPPRLAPLGPALAPRADTEREALDDAELLGPLGASIASVSSSLIKLRLSAGEELRRTFPRPGHAAAAAGLALASATLASLGFLAMAAVPEVEAVAGPAVVLGVQPTLVDRADGAPAGIVPSPLTAEPSAQTEPGAVGGGEAGEGHAHGQTHAHVHESARAGEVLEVPRLHRISSLTPPAPALSTAGVATQPAGTPRLHRLSRSEVMAATPAPPLVMPGDTRVPIVPTGVGALPLGMGMWLYIPEEIEGGNVDALVARAQQVGLTHVYLRTGSSRGGFYAQRYMDELLPKAHAAGIRVYGWDFPYLDDVDSDVTRAVTAITYTTPSGDRLDGFAADIETASEGTNLSAEGAGAYGQRLRESVGAAYPLVAVVPRPSTQMQVRYPYAAVIPHFDAVAPMTYWLNRQPDTDVSNDVGFLISFGKPVLPIGQAYDGAPEGGRPGPPPPEEIQRFLSAAQQAGAAGVSFWSWQHANQAIWDTLQAAPEFRWEAGTPDTLRVDQVRALQAQLSRHGYPLGATGAWDDLTTDALRRYQERAGLPRSGVLDVATLAVLMEPFNPPVGDISGGGGNGGDVDGEIDLGLVEVDLPLG